MAHIPYTNASQTLVDLGRNEIQVLFYTYQPLTPQMQAGRIKILGSTGATRSAWAPEIPTMEEAGLSGFVMPAWHGVLAPAKTPKEIVGILERALAKVAADPDYKKTIEPTGTDDKLGAPDAGVNHLSVLDRRARILLACDDHGWNIDLLQTMPDVEP